MPPPWATAGCVLGTVRTTCYHGIAMSGLDEHLIEERFAATEPRRWGLYVLYTLVLVVVGGMMLLPALGSQRDRPEVLGILLLGTLIGLLMLAGWLVGQRQRRCRQEVIKAWAHAQLEEWEAARAILDEVMQRPIQSPSDRGQAFMTLAAIAEHESCHDAAAQIYETLLLRRIGDPVYLQQAQIALASAKIRNQELTDAMDLLGRLEKVPMPTGLRAALDMVRLFQQVFMGHYEDAVEECEERRLLYRRHLSTHAAYGYGLLAAAMHHLGRTSEAAQLWGEATTLIDADRLVREYALLATVSQAYPATSKPPALSLWHGRPGREGTEEHHRRDTGATKTGS